MKRVGKLFSIVLMSIAMLACFLFASVMMVTAEVPESFKASNGARILIGANIDQTGIRFDAEISEEDYVALKSTNQTIEFGFALGSEKMGELNETNHFSSNGLVRVKTVDVTDSTTDLRASGDKRVMSWGITYNESSESSLGGMTQEQKDKVYMAGFVARPYYKTNGVYYFGAQSPARSMTKVTVAELNSNPNLDSGVLARYVNGSVVDGGEIAFQLGLGEGFSGFSNDGYDIGEIVKFTVESSAQVVATGQNSFVDTTFATGAPYGKVFTIYGYTADRKVVKFTATYYGFVTGTITPPNQGGAGSFTQVISNEALLSLSDKKLYLQETGITGTVTSVKTSTAGEEYLVDGEINVGAMGLTSGSTGVDLYIKANGSDYVLQNVSVYDKVFENTAESRIAFATLFSARAVKNPDGSDNRAAKVNHAASLTIEGNYALAENIFFNRGAEGVWSTEEAINNGPGGGSNAVIFKGTFDGRGYSLNDIPLYCDSANNINGNYGIFGVAGDGAVIKNVAFNQFYYFHEGAYEYSATKNSTPKIDCSNGYNTIGGSALFYRPETTTASITLENVYLYTNRSGDVRNVGVIFRDAISTTAEDALGALTIRNSYFEVDTNIDYDYTAMIVGQGTYTSANIAAKPEKVTLDNVYFVSTSSLNNYPILMARGGVNWDGVTNYFGKTKLAAAYEAGGYAYGLSTDYWKVDEVTNTPIFNCYTNKPYLALADGTTLESITAPGTYYAGYKNLVSGNITEGITIEKSGDIGNKITIDGNQVKVASGNYKIDASISVKKGSDVLATYTVNFDAREAKTITKEVLLSKTSGKLFFNGVSELKGKVATSVEYNSEEVLTATQNVLDASKLSGIEVGANGATIELAAEIDGEKYSLTNVLVATEVFEDTPESRALMAKIFSAYETDGLTTGRRPSKAVAERKLSGYFALAETLNFTYTYEGYDFNVADEAFTNNNHATMTFSGTFDGRGYALNNVLLGHNYDLPKGMFGDAGHGATIKNVAINSFAVYTCSSKTISNSVSSRNASQIFYGIDTTSNNGVEVEIKFENVYIKADVGNSAVLFRDAADVGNALSKISISNSIIEVVDDVVVTAGNNDRHLFFGEINKTQAELTGITVENSYFITKFTVSKYQNVWSNQYADMDALKTAFAEGGYNYGLSTDYWAVVDGVPAFKALANSAYLKNAQGEKIESITSAGTYTAGYENLVNGDFDNVTLEVENGVEKVTINGNQVIVAEGQYEINATLIVKYNGESIKTYTIAFDSRTLNNNAEEIVLIKDTGKLSFYNTTLENGEVSAISYNEESILVSAVENVIVNATAFASLEDGAVITLDAEIDGLLYRLTNVVVYATEYSLYFENAHKEAIESITEPGTYYAGYESIITGAVNGVTIEAINDAQGKITIDGNEIVVADGQYKINASIVIKQGEEELASYNVVFDNRVATEVSGALISKTSGKVFLNDTTIAGKEIAVATLGEENILTATNVVDASKLPAIVGNVASSVDSLIVETSDGGLYNLTNVTVATDVFENTRESRIAFATLFSQRAVNNPDGTLNRAGSTQKTIVGYYTLVENITFNRGVAGAWVTEEAINNGPGAGANTVKFNATFDGRGFALNDIPLYCAAGTGSGRSWGLFGTPVDGAVIKNVAFNQFYYFHEGAYTYGENKAALSSAPTDCSNGYNTIGGSALFYKPDSATASITLENVYLYTNRVGIEATSATGIIFRDAFSSNAEEALASLTIRNSYFEVDTNIDYDYTAMFVGRGAYTTATIAAKPESVTLNNAYFVSTSSLNNYAINMSNGGVNWAGVNKYFGKAKLAAAYAESGYEYGLSASYWSVGASNTPVWNSLAG